MGRERALGTLQGLGRVALNSPLLGPSDQAEESSFLSVNQNWKQSSMLPFQKGKKDALTM